MIRSALSLALAATVIALAGCGSAPPEHYYTLNPVAAPANVTPSNLAIAIAVVSIPPAVDRPQFVINQPDNSLSLLEQQRWAAPLKNQIPATLAVDLSRILGTPNVTAWPQLPLPTTSWTISVNIQRFDSIPDKMAVQEASWQILDKTSTPVKSGRSAYEEPLQGTGYAAMAAAHERALGKLAAEIAAAIPATTGK
ncbi:PqiC family protein [Silvimonas iriomotensis]|uniref:Lipoprotein n=1 Tax=Silvimonas iriomotensis TaxID=449662 RepID=A0ABQ2P542_9NEIS|nr:PqiC family protein [Silvimonas iriomotensis]GGP18412.1 lipoprotein [Silvimonas iriomotensis]